MTDATPRWLLPFTAVGQAQKEWTHNEALVLVDLLTHPCVEAVGVNAPPVAPALGQCWIVGDSPTGEWIGHVRALAAGPMAGGDSCRRASD